MTGNSHVDWLPEASVAVQFTRVVPRGKKLPEGGTHTTPGEGSRLSLAVTVNVATSPLGLAKASITCTDEGQERPQLAPRAAAGSGTFQMRSAYSRIERSEEKRPTRAALSTDMRSQRRGSAKAAATRSWQAE